MDLRGCATTEVARRGCLLWTVRAGGGAEAQINEHHWINNAGCSLDTDPYKKLFVRHSIKTGRRKSSFWGTGWIADS